MRLTLAGAVAALALAAGSASASDLYSNGSTKDAPTILGASNNPIAGAYVELSTGFGFSSNNISLLSRSADLSSDGGLLNGRIGYDFKLPNHPFGVGVYVEGGDNFDVNGDETGLKWSENWTWGAGGKLFYDHGLGQVYVLGGYAGANEVITPTGYPKITKTLSGGEWGVGISLKLAGNLYGKLEFNQIIYDAQNLGKAGVDPVWKQVDDRVLFGIGYSFGQFAALK